MIEAAYRIRQLIMVASAVALANAALLILYVPHTFVAIIAAVLTGFFICAAPILAGVHIIALVRDTERPLE